LKSQVVDLNDQLKRVVKSKAADIEHYNALFLSKNKELSDQLAQVKDELKEASATAGSWKSIAEDLNMRLMATSLIQEEIKPEDVNHLKDVSLDFLIRIFFNCVMLFI
jgi:hypothetical protein